MISMRTWLILAGILLVAGPSLAANDWPQARYNETHQGAVPTASNTEFGAFKQGWWNQSLSGPLGSPAVRENIVYVGDVTGRLYAFDQESGGVLWSNTTGAKISGTPAVGGDFVYVVNEGGAIYSFNRKTGVAQSGYPISVGATFGSLLLHEDILYVGDSGGKLQAYFASQKTKKWEFGSSGSFFNTTCSGGAIVTTPVVFEGRVMVGTTSKCFFAVPTSSFGSVATPEWVFQAIDSIRSTPAVDVTNKRVIFGDVSGKVYAIPVASTGAVTSAAWTYTEPLAGGLSSEINAAAAIGGDKVIVAFFNGNIRAIPLGSSGTVTSAAWTRNLNGKVDSSPAIANGHVLVGSYDRKMYMLSISDGAIRDTRDAFAEINTSPAISGSQGFWADQQGFFYAYGGDRPARADLVVEGFSVPSMYSGQAASLSANVRNAGTVASTPAIATLLVGSTSVQDFQIPALQPGEATSISATYVPAATGTLVFTLFADSGRAVQETNESNNVASGTATVNPPPTQDTTSAGAGETEEEGIPGFALGLALLALAAVVALRRR